MSIIIRALKIDDPNEAPESVVQALEEIVADCSWDSEHSGAADGHTQATVSDIVAILTRKQFCYLSKTRMKAYEATIEHSIGAALSDGAPIPFYFDVGGGYHASIDPAEPALSFDVGLSELCILRQICLFAKRVSEVYRPGLRFVLVVDNLCAHFVNDIALERTETYCDRLRRLIRELGLDESVSVLVESELIEVSAYADMIRAVPESHASIPVSPQIVENVSRFLGRSCEAGEAAARLQAYERTSEVSEAVVGPHVHGLRMTQRASPTTPPFRPFPGGDLRTQAGELVLVAADGGRVKYCLITTKNFADFDLAEVPLPSRLPRVLKSVRFAKRRA